MYSVSLKFYAAYIDDFTGRSSSDGMARVFSASRISEAKKEQLITARVCGGECIKNLLLQWICYSIKCFKSLIFLVVNHINSCRLSDNEEILGINNALLLLPNHDMAFDMGYISSTNKRKIMISEYLEQDNDIGAHKEIFST